MTHTDHSTTSYWDYIQTEALLSLQNPKTNLPDEAVFIMYHQVTELVFKMILHELQQLVENPFSTDAMGIKVDRINRYTELLISSFAIMKHGMDHNEYNRFRKELAPASGFQSVQFRYIEIYCTRITNLLSKNITIDLGASPSVALCFEYLYWKEAGHDHQTGKKTPTLLDFEEKYEKELISLATNVRGKTLEDQLLNLPNPNPAIEEKLKTLRKLAHPTHIFIM